MNKRLTIVIVILLSFSCLYLGCSETKTTEPNSDLLLVTNFTQEFTAPFGGPSPNQLFFVLSSSTDKVLNYTISNNSSWLQLFNSKQTLTGFTSDSILFAIKVALPVTLAEGIYYDTITITTDSTLQEPIVREIILHIGSEISAMPDSFEFVANLNGLNPAIQTLEINSTSSAQFDVVMSNLSSWLTIPNFPYNTNDTDKIPVSINISGLTKGDFIDTIWVTSDTALNSPFPIEVLLQIRSWLEQVSPRKNSLNDVYFVDAQTGWAVGDIIDANSKSGFLIKTTDGGKHWEEVLFLSSTTSSDSILGGVTFIGNKGWTIGTTGIIMYSDDFGEVWSYQNPPNGLMVDLNDLSFVSADSGWIVGDSGIIYATSDGGTNWILQTSPIVQVLTGVTFVDNMHGWISGLTDVILVTSDGGVNWTQQTVPPQVPGVGNKFDFKEIMFTDLLHGFAVGKLGSFISTTDGGITWSFQEIVQQPGLQSLFFVDEFTGWIVGQNGLVLQTTDGGSSWINQFIGTTKLLQSIFFVNQNTGWVVGSDGFIVHTASGGN